MFAYPNKVITFEFLGGIAVIFWDNLERFAAEDVSVEIETDVGDDEIEKGMVDDGVGEGS